MDFIDLEKAYDRVNRKGLWGKLLRGIKTMFVIKRGWSEQFRIDSGVRQECIMSCSMYIWME